MNKISSDKQRIKYLDYTKGLGILLIMFAHSIQYFSPMWGLNGYVCSFHVPIFFMVSGCLAFYHDDRRSIQTKILSRFKSLIIPYIIFSLFNSALKLGVLFITGGITDAIIKSEMIALLITGNGTVWFLLTLFLTELVYILFLNRWKDNKLFVIITSCIGLILPYLINDLLTGPFGIVIKRVIGAIGYYMFGILLAELIEFVKAGTVIISGVVLTVLGSISYIVFGSDYGFFGGGFNSVIPSLAASLLIGVGLIMIFSYMDRKNCRNKALEILTYYGKNSLIVMLVHPTLLLMATYPLGGWFGELTGVTGVVIALLLFVILTVFEIPFIELINRYFPWLIGKTKSKR